MPLGEWPWLAAPGEIDDDRVGGSGNFLCQIRGIRVGALFGRVPLDAFLTNRLLNAVPLVLSDHAFIIEVCPPQSLRRSLASHAYNN